MTANRQKPLSRLPQGGEAKTTPSREPLHSQRPRQRTDKRLAHALSFRKGATQHAEQSPQSGKGPAPPPFLLTSTCKIYMLVQVLRFRLMECISISHSLAELLE